MTYIPANAKCNHCGAIKGETNNWYMIHPSDRKLFIYQFDMNEVASGIPCVCGEACLQKYISKHISVIYPPAAAQEAESFAQIVFNEEEYRERSNEEHES